VKKELLILILLAYLLPLFSQKKWDLQECINYALDNNLLLKTQELSTLMAKNEYHGSKFHFLPSINTKYGHQLSYGRSLNLEKYEWETSDKQQGSFVLQVEFDLLNSFKNYNNIKRTPYYLKSEQAILEKERGNISMEVISSYLEILLAQEKYNLAKGQLELIRIQEERTEEKIKAGIIAHGEIYEIRAQVSYESAKLVEAKNRLRIDYINLAHLLNIKYLENFEIQKLSDLNIDNFDIYPIDSIFQIARGIMPAVKEADYKIKAAKKELSITRGKRYPDVSILYSYSTRYIQNALNPLDPDPLQPSLDYLYLDQITNNQYKQIAISLSIPVFNKFQVEKKIEKKKIIVKKEILNRQEVLQDLYGNIQLAVANAFKARASYHTGLGSVARYQEAGNYSREKFNAGLTNSVEYITSKNNMIKARSELLQAKYNYIFCLKILNYYMGKKIN